MLEIFDGLILNLQESIKYILFEKKNNLYLFIKYNVLHRIYKRNKVTIKYLSLGTMVTESFYR